MQHLFFLINPISGGRSKDKIVLDIDKYLDKTQFTFETTYTEYPGHASHLLQKRMNLNETVVAVGGDGTINEIAKVLAGTDKSMAIIPQGSGNGLARHLGISVKPRKAIQQLNDLKSIKVDTAKLNEWFFISIAGIGFDSLIAQKFVSSKNRGFFGYASLVLKEFISYREQDFDIEIDGVLQRKKAALVSFANSNQFGYNTIIAQNADVSDGLLEVCIFRKPKWFQLPSVLLKVWTKNANRSSLLEIISAKSISLYPNQLKYANVDGESIHVGEKIQVEIIPSNLNLKVPNDG